MRKTNLNSVPIPESNVPTESESNFDMGKCLCNVKCIHRHKTRMFNLHRGHYVACDTCRTYIFVSANLMSSWRQENKDIWQANYDSVNGYRFIE